MPKPKWYPHQQLQLWHDFVNLRLTLDQIALRHQRPRKEIEDRLQEMQLLHKDRDEVFHRIGVAAKTPEERAIANGIQR